MISLFFRTQKENPINNNDIIYLQADFIFNPDLFGQFLNQFAGQFLYCSFSDFLQAKNEILTKPKPPNKPIYSGSNSIKKRVFEQVYSRLLLQYQNHLKIYEKKKEFQAILNNYSPDYRGYSQYLADHKKSIIAPFLFRRNSIPVSEYNRQLHTYITGGTGSGKSEVIKSFIWHYLTRNTNTGIILLTPHGKIAEEVAKFKTNTENNRLVYICPDLKAGFFPCLNPFDIPNKEDLTDREAENYAEEFRAVFQELLHDGGGFTEQMNALLKNTLPVLMKYPNSSVYDLLDFLATNDTRASKFLKFANENFANPAMLEFLNGQFVSDNSYKRTKNAMQTRLHSLFSSTLMQKMMNDKASLDLEALINEKKLIVFNISKGACPQEWEILGKFIIAQIKIIAFKRDKKPEQYRTPCHLFIDEFQNYITPSIQEILEESRKYRLYLTLAQQTAGAKMNKELLRSILGNTGIKITGRNGDIDTLNTLARSTGANMEDLTEKLATGRFSLWRNALTNEQQAPPVIVSMPTNTLDDKQSMNAEQWESVKNEQIRAFYRSGDIEPTETEKTAENAEKSPKNVNIDLSNYLN